MFTYKIGNRTTKIAPKPGWEESEHVTYRINVSIGSTVLLDEIRSQERVSFNYLLESLERLAR